MEETIRKYLKELKVEYEDGKKYLPENDAWLSYLQGKIDAYTNILEELENKK